MSFRDPNAERENDLIGIEELIGMEVAKLPEELQRQVYDFARFLRWKDQDSFNGLLMSASTLTKLWETPEEEEAWINL